MTSPIRLYLDTSDYAVMCNATPGTEHACVRDYLLHMKNSGQIEIGLSYHVVFELLQKAEPKYRENRMARARLLKLLCDKNAFPYPTDMPQGHRYAKDGLWIPRIWLVLLRHKPNGGPAYPVISGKTADHSTSQTPPRCWVSAFCDAVVLEEIEIERIVKLVMAGIANCPSINRHQRRALSKREYFVSWACRNPMALRKILPEVWPVQFGEELYKSGDFIRYLSGNISRQEANARIRFFVTDLEAVYETWFENYGRKSPVLKARGSIANLIIATIEKLNEMLDDCSSIKKDTKKALGSTSDPLTSEDRQRIMEVRQNIEKLGSEITSPSDLAKNAVWIKAIGEEGALLAAQVFYALHSEKRAIKVSDAIDLMHSMYYPTLISGEVKGICHMLIKHGVNFHERVVTSLLDLPSRIDAEIANR